jgi:predicted dehydrogenase
MCLRIGLIGFGGLGYLQAKTYRELETVSIVAAADVTADARDLFEREFDAPAYQNYRALLDKRAEDLDAVTIVTPHTLHYDQAKACLERGLHVLIEKPMVTDIGHARDLVELADERDLMVQVGYQRHFHPAFRQMRDLVVSGAIGELRSVNCFIEQDWIDSHRDTWRVDPDFSGGGQLYDTGSHLLEALLWVTDADAKQVTAQIDYHGSAIDVNSAATIELDDGGTPITASVGITGNGQDIVPAEGYFLWGSDGAVTYADDRLVVTGAENVTYESEIPSDYDFDVLNRRKLENFVASIEGTAEPAVPAEVGFDVTILTEAIYDAANRGERIDLATYLESSRAA